MVETLAPALVRVWVESLVHSWDLLKADLKVAWKVVSWVYLWVFLWVEERDGQSGGWTVGSLGAQTDARLDELWAVEMAASLE